MDAIKKVLRHVRNIHVNPPEADPVDVRLAERAGELRLWEMHRAGIELVRDRNFEKAKLVRAQNIENRRIERENENIRQEQIEKTRMKNLKKARRALERKRNGISTE